MIDYQKILNHPQVLILKKLIENEPTHTHEKNTWHHSQRVFKKLKQTLRLDFIKNKKTKNRINLYLNQKVGRLKRKECLLIAAIVHDLGKYYTRKIDKNGFFISPGHEKDTPKRIDFLKDLMNLAPKDLNLMKKIVRNHMALFPYLNYQKFNKLTPQFLNKITKNLSLEIILHAFAEIKVARPPKSQKILIKKLLSRSAIQSLP